MPTPLTTELTLLGWSVVLFVAYMVAQATPALLEQGPAFNAGPRDNPPPLGIMAGRGKRAFENFKETYPLFIALALGLALTGRGGGEAATGAWLWFGGRIVYLPLYLAGVPWLRTLAYAVSVVGLAMMAVKFLV
jgi:uncharacterized MAPEG superfamily protein